MPTNIQLSRVSRPAGDKRTGSGTILAGIRLSGLRPPEIRIDPRWRKAFPEQASIFQEWNKEFLEWWRKVVALTDIGATSSQSESIAASELATSTGASPSTSGESASASESTPEVGTSSPPASSSSSSSSSASAVNSLIQWTAEEAYRMVSTTMHSSGHVQTATVRWPDGSMGVFTTLAFNTTHKAIDSYEITHANSGRRVFQPPIVRDIYGNPIKLPDIILL